MIGTRIRLAHDQERPRSRSFGASKRAEESYARALRRITRNIGRVVQALYPDSGEPSTEAAKTISIALGRYAEALGPWATAAATRMLADVDREDARDWFSYSERIGRHLRAEIAQAPTGVFMRAQLDAQVHLIKSLPLEAARRVHEMTLEAVGNGDRASSLVDEIMRSGDVSFSRARTIARTETSRTRALLTEARATQIGSVGYIWKSSRDAQVRPSHKAMQGQFVSWSAPPTLDGMTGHAGCFPNCRCTAAPVIPEGF